MLIDNAQFSPMWCKNCIPPSCHICPCHIAVPYACGSARAVALYQGRSDLVIRKGFKLSVKYSMNSINTIDGSPAMNIFDLKIDGGTVAVGDVVICKIDWQGKAKVPNGDVKLCIRPEHLVPVDKGGIDVTFQVAEPLGATRCCMASWSRPVRQSLSACQGCIRRVRRLEQPMSQKISQRVSLARTAGVFQ